MSIQTGWRDAGKYCDRSGAYMDEETIMTSGAKVGGLWPNPVHVQSLSTDSSPVTASTYSVKGKKKHFSLLQI